MDFNLACFHKSKQSTLPEELRTTPNNLLTEIPIVSNRFDLPPKKLDCYLKDCFRYCIGLSPFNFS